MRWVKAKYKDEAFLEEVSQSIHQTDTLKLWWLGQSGFLIQYNGIHLLIDPYLSDSLTIKYASSSKPHVRLCEKVIDPAKLDFIDIVTSSHNHTDHLDADTLVPLFNANPGITFIIPEANRAFVTQRVNKPLNFPIGLNDGQSVEIKGINFTGIPSAHNELERDENGRCRYMGYVIRIGEKKIYHSGDTLLFPRMIDLLNPFDIDLAILPINGNDPSRAVAGNLNSDEASRLAKDIGAKLVIPCHYDMFAFNTADVSQFIWACERLDVQYKVMDIGGCFQLD